ncbi:hypothetical protein [Luteibacter sp. SG786]|uniref:hypothetical protein n=1 Tax=Luteibacter sp. SG786 TaxID=2587130 RepID=UPI00142230AB|nr:hypothetical protein [Luteibacter sp. SG786]NII53954.1 hypothetical protein [Luteibacter sp. SG786]
MLAQLAAHYGATAHAHGTVFDMEVDPALVPELVGPSHALANALSLLLDRAFGADAGRVALHVDVVSDDIAGQVVHFTVAEERATCEPNDANVREAATIVAAVGGTVHTEQCSDIGDRVIVELAFDLPHTPPCVDVDALRSALGGEAALREVVIALDRALSIDVADLDLLLQREGIAHLQAWLHRVSGALGMAEARELSRVGLALERELENGRRPRLDRAIRRFAEDAVGVFRTLREQVPADRL